MVYTFEFNEKIPADLQRVNPFIERVLQAFATLGKVSEDIFEIKLALEEGLTNAMRHGNKLEPDSFVSVSVKIGPKQVLIDIHDEGKGFDFKNIPDPTARENSARASGRGVFLMRRIMDTVDFYDNGSGLRMVKNL